MERILKTVSRSFKRTPIFLRIEEKSTEIEAFEGAQIAAAKTMLSQPILGILFKSKSFEFHFWAAAPTGDEVL